MTPVRDRRKPTDAELAILRVLWSRGPSTVRDVFDALGAEGAYTTVLKLLQIMTDKGLVRRDESTRTHVYEAVGSEQQTQKQLVADLLERAFNGSAGRLVLHALESGQASADEIAAIRQLLDKHRQAIPSSGASKEDPGAGSRSSDRQKKNRGRR